MNVALLILGIVCVYSSIINVSMVLLSGSEEPKGRQFLIVYLSPFIILLTYAAKLVSRIPVQGRI